MPIFENINLGFTFNPFLIIPGIFFLAVYTYFIYKFTIPKVKPVFKYFLITLRFFVLLIILFVIFEPIITINYNIEEFPKTYVFVDESKSIVNDDSTSRSMLIKTLLNDISDNSENEVKLYSFAGKIDSLEKNQIDRISFNGNLTNLSAVLNFLNSAKENISSAVIISDGIITDGSNPIYQSERLEFPLFTVGVGDSLDRKDISINKILHNDYIYAQKPTTITANILNTGFGGNSVIVKLVEDKNIVQQKNIELSENGINNIKFDYTPVSSGEKILRVEVSNIEGEATFANNEKSFLINVIDNKVKILLLAGAPSEDFSFIKNSLKLDDNFDVSSIVQISKDKFLGNDNFIQKIDSADVLFLIGFPASNSPINLSNKVLENIKNKNKPFLITMSPSVDLQKLKLFESELPFVISEIKYEKVLVQPDIIDITNPLLNNNSTNPIEEWNNLPPVSIFNSGLLSKPESDIISKTKISNIPVNTPLILTRAAGRSRSIAITASNIWKWKLQKSRINLFDNFIFNSVKWLNTNSNKKNVEISTTKKIYNQGEQVEFTAQVFDEIFNPLDNAEIKVIVKNDNTTDEVILTSVGSGLYESNYQSYSSGAFEYSGEARISEKLLGNDNGKFNVSEISIEKIDTKMDKNLMLQMSNLTGGKYYDLSDSNSIINEINDKKYNKVLNKSYIQEIDLWSNETLLIIIILLFSLEWFFRKRAGML